MFTEETDGYTVGKETKEELKEHTAYRESSKRWSCEWNDCESHHDSGACNGVKKYKEIVFRKSKMIKREGLAVLEEKMDALDPSKN